MNHVYQNSVQQMVSGELAGEGLQTVFSRHGFQEVLNPTPLNPTPATCHKRKRKLRCNFWNAVLQKLHCNIRFSAVQKSFVPKAALQQTKNCTATSKSLRCRKVALSCRFPAGFKPPRLGTHVSDLLRFTPSESSAGHGLPPQRAPKQCPANGVRRAL